MEGGSASVRSTWTTVPRSASRCPTDAVPVRYGADVGTFADLTLSRVPSGIAVPDPLRMLFDWVEANGFVETAGDGDVYGSLSAEWPRGPGTNLLLRGSRPDEVGAELAAWFGPVRDGLPTLWPFCRTGADGSMAALWLDPTGQTRIVHMGSGSGSLLTCELGNDAVDFLRLIAIGYDEICWNEDWAHPPAPEPDHPILNERYRRWVETTFNTTIPDTALEIVQHPAEMGDVETEDVWCQWVNAQTG